MDSRCLAWLAPRKFELQSRQIKAPSDFEILLKVFATSICGSDLRIYREGNTRVTAPRVLGHEISGVVVEKGKAVQNFQIGDRVSLGADVPCAKCEYCLAGHPNCCRTNLAIGYQFDGGFSDYMIIPELAVRYGPIQKISAETPSESACLAEPLSCCINGYEAVMAQVRNPKTMVVFGAGPIGQMLGMLAPQFGVSKTIFVEPRAGRRDLVLKNVEGSIALDPAGEDLAGAVMEHTSGKGADLVFTACSTVEAQSQALTVVGVRGVINWFGGVPKNSPAISVDSNLIHYKEIVVTGSHGATPLHLQKAVSLIENGKIKVGRLITHTYSLSEYEEAFRLAESGAALKVLIQP